MIRPSARTAGSNNSRIPSVPILYAAQGLLSFVLNGIGAVLLPLREGLQAPRSAVAFYPSLVAVALLAVGLCGASVTRRLGGRVVLMAGLVALAAGSVLLAVPRWIATTGGAVLIGSGCAALIHVLPLLLHRRSDGRGGRAVARANALGSFAAPLPALLIAGSMSVAQNWSVGYTVPTVVVAALLLGTAHRRGQRAPGPAGAPTGPATTAWRGAWLNLVLAVGVEFSCVYWTADALASWHQLSAGAATAAAASFLLGMATTRLAAGGLVGRWSDRQLLPACCGLAMGGFALFWGSTATAVAIGGLGLLGAGVGPMYPACLTRLIESRADSPERGAALGALASGVAMGTLPTALPYLAGWIGLRYGYLAVPAVLLVLLLRTIARPRGVSGVGTVNHGRGRLERAGATGRPGRQRPPTAPGRPGP